MGEQFRLGLIGAGRMGRTHLRALAGSARVKVTAIAEPVEAAREVAAQGSGATGFATVEELIAAHAVDGVLIAVPSDRHAAVVEQVASAGLPILCEKPCGVTPADVARAAAAARTHAVPLQVAYWRRFVPPLQELHGRIAAGELGDVLFAASFQWDGSPPAVQFRAHSGGIFVDMGVHEFDQLRWLTGQDIDSVSTMASPLVTDVDATADVDAAQALLEMSGGTTGLVSLGRWFPGGDMARIEVFGTRDAVRSTSSIRPRARPFSSTRSRRQAEAFADYATGGSPAGATVDDAAKALTAAVNATRAVPRLANQLAASSTA